MHKAVTFNKTLNNIHFLIIKLKVQCFKYIFHCNAPAEQYVQIVRWNPRHFSCHIQKNITPKVTENFSSSFHWKSLNFSNLWTICQQIRMVSESMCFFQNNVSDIHFQVLQTLGTTIIEKNNGKIKGPHLY